MALHTKKTDTGRWLGGIPEEFSVPVICWEPKLEREKNLIVHKYARESFPSGSVLKVGPSQLAVFLCSLRPDELENNVSARDQILIFHGPCSVILDTGESRFAPLRKTLQKMTDGQSAFVSSAYFIETAIQNDLAWGTREPVSLKDPEEKISVRVQAQGSCNVCIEKTDTSIADERALTLLCKVVGAKADFSRDELLELVRQQIMACAPDAIAAKIRESGTSTLDQGGHYSEIAEEIQQKLRGRLEDFGISLCGFSVTAINLLPEDADFIRKNQRNVSAARSEAEAAAIKAESDANILETLGLTAKDKETFEVMKEAVKANGSGAALDVLHYGAAIGAMKAMGEKVDELFRPRTAPQQPAYGTRDDGQLTCPNPVCHAKVPSDAQFCPQCRTPIEPIHTCPQCRRTFRLAARFCPYCSKEL